MTAVLLVEDDNDLSMIFSLVLARAGFTVLSVADGLAAMAIASSRRVDAVVSDLDMPRMNGWQLCTALRSDAAVADVPIALLSGSLLPGDERAMQARACRAWAKPIGNAELVAGVTELLHAGRHGHPVTSSECRRLAVCA